MEGMSEDRFLMITDIVMRLHGKPQLIIDEAIKSALAKIEKDGNRTLRRRKD